MSIGSIGAGGRVLASCADPTEDPAEIGRAGARPAGGVSGGSSLDELAQLMVEADREDRNAARATARALAASARAERRAAIRDQRAAAADAFDSAVLQAVVGGLAAVAQGVAAVGAAAAVGEAAAAAQGAVSAGAVGQAAPAGVPWHRWVELGAEVLPHSAPLLDQPARWAEANRIRAQEHQDAAAFLDDGVRRAVDDAEAARAARRAHVEAVGRAVDLIEQGRAIAIGREAG